MQTTLLIISILLAAINLIILLYLALRKKNGQTDRGDLRQMEEKLHSIASLTDYCARATENLNRTTEQRLSGIQARLTEDIKYIIDANAHNLERIRRTVDDKLTSSLDGRLSESYARIAERLEKMYESVGEMKSLSQSVTDIKRVFTNVKLRGTWGETQLNALLEQMLAPEQYRSSVRLNPLDNTLVDFAVLLPAKNGDTVYLPIDSKFPVEEFERLCAASERNDRDGVAEARKKLERAVKTQAESIASKYILPPVTTDFAIMYLPLEGLYAEVLKMPALAEFLHTKRVMVCGPTNFGALLSTCQTGFRTAAIEKRSGELRQMLEAFRLDFYKFSELLDKTSKKLREAQDSIESAAKRTNQIGRKLDSFRALGTPPDPPDESRD